MKEFLLSLAMRAVPAMSGALVTWGVSTEHAEPIALGVLLAAVTGVDLAIKAVKARTNG